jgi:hypothetical protein
MEQVNSLIERGSISYSEHFELTYVSGTQKTHLGDFCDVTKINCELMGVILAELEHDPDTLHSFEQRLEGSIWCWTGGNPGYELPGLKVTFDEEGSIWFWIGDTYVYELPSIKVTLDEGCCDLLPHGMWKRVTISFNDSYPTVLRFRVRKKVQLKSLMELTSIAVAECLLLETDCNLLEVPRDLIPDIRSGFQSCWTPRSHRVNMHDGSRQLCKEHVECASCICFSNSSNGSLYCLMIK